MAKKTTKTAKKAPNKKPAPKKSSTKKGAAKKSGAKKAATKKSGAKKAATKKSSAKKAATKKNSAKKGAAKKAVKGKATLSAIKKAAGKKKIRPVGKPQKRGAKAQPPPSSDDDDKRNFGLRGAAPWVARHAAKHAEELRKRNAEPPPPGSARATLRVPAEAEQIKAEIGELHQLTSQVRALRKRLDKSFFEIGELLSEVQVKELYLAKGYSSFESFLDREVDLPRTTSQRLVRISHTFQRDTAYDFGLDRLMAALSALDGELTPAPPSQASSRGFSSTALPPKPPIRWDD